MKIKSYQELDIWKKAISIADQVYDLTEKFPEQERYGLVSQMRRAAVSIPSNIAEGFIRQHDKEFVQFLYIALGSSAELETQLIIAQRRHFISEPVLKNVQDELTHEGKMLMNFIKYLKNCSHK